MITQTNFQAADSDRADMKNEMSPQQTSLHPASFDDEDFDAIPQVNWMTLLIPL